MGVQTFVDYMVICDNYHKNPGDCLGCENTYLIDDSGIWQEHSIHDAISKAREDGWLINDDWSIVNCPECQERGTQRVTTLIHTKGEE